MKEWIPQRNEIYQIEEWLYARESGVRNISLFPTICTKIVELLVG